MSKRVILLTVMALSLNAQANPETANALIQDHRAALKRWEVSLLENATNEQRVEWLKRRPSEAVLIPRIWAQIRDHLGEESSLPTIAWMLENPHAWNGLKVNEREKIFEELMDTLEHQQILSPKLGLICSPLAKLEHPRALSIIAKIIKVNPHTKVKGLAHLANALILRRLGDDPRAMADRKEHLRKAIELAGDQDFGGVLALEVVKNELYLVKHLMLGRVSPSFVLPDQDGKSFNLLQERGKFTVLCFWSTKSAMSVQSLPIMNSVAGHLAKLNEGKSAKFLGILSDSVSSLKKLSETQEVNFRNLIDHGGGTAYEYRVEMVPMIYVIDPAGKVAYKGDLNSGISLVVEDLVKKAGISKEIPAANPLP